MARAGEESRSSRSFFPGNCRYLRDRLPGLSTRVYPDKIFLARRQALILRYENSRRASLLAEQKSPLCLSLSLYTLTLGHPHARDGRVKERESGEGSGRTFLADARTRFESFLELICCSWKIVFELLIAPCLRRRLVRFGSLHRDPAANDRHSCSLLPLISTIVFTVLDIYELDQPSFYRYHANAGSFLFSSVSSPPRSSFP